MNKIYAYVMGNPIRYTDRFGLSSGQSLSASECAALAQDIANEQATIASLQNMIANFQPGQNFGSYGLGPQASVTGFRSSSFSSHSQTFQNSVNQMEGNIGFNLGIGLGNAIVGGIGYYTLGLFGFLHDTTAEVQQATTYAGSEEMRSEYVLNLLNKAYADSCPCHK